jgi:Xaa-Pro aminopeptidase
MIHPGFPKAEYEGRFRALQQKLREADLAGAIVTGEANYNYFAGYHHFAPWTTFCRPVFCFLPTEGDPVLLVHAFPAADAKRDCWFDDVRGYDSLTFAPLEEVVEIAKQRGLFGEQIGMELGSEHRLGLTPIEFEELRKDLGSTTIVDAGQLLWDLRIIKSQAEIHHLKEAGRISAHAFGRCFDQVRAGMTERDLADILGAAIHEQGGQLGFFIMTSGEGFYDRVAGLPRERALQPGDFLWIDLGVVYGGYWSDHCRAAVVGSATQDQRDMWTAITTLTRATVDQCRPGKTPVDIVSFIQEEGKRMGLDFSFAAGRSGHGIGLMSTEPPHIALYDSTDLKPGMAFSIEPGWIDQRQGVFVAEENLVLTDDGFDLLTVTPRELIEA